MGLLKKRDIPQALQDVTKETQILQELTGESELALNSLNQIAKAERVCPTGCPP